jgi:hypothetical protein
LGKALHAFGNGGRFRKFGWTDLRRERGDYLGRGFFHRLGKYGLGKALHVFGRAGRRIFAGNFGTDFRNRAGGLERGRLRRNPYPGSRGTGI